MKRVVERYSDVVSGQLTTAHENRVDRNLYRLGEGQAKKGSSALWEWGWRTIETHYLVHLRCPVHTVNWHGYEAVPQPKMCIYLHPLGMLAYSPLDTCIWCSDGRMDSH